MTTATRAVPALIRPFVKPLLDRGAAVAGTAQSAVQKQAFRAAMALPEPVQRRIVGRPVVVDGQTLATDVQLMLLMTRLTGPAVETLPIKQGRKVLDAQCELIGGEQPIGETRELWVSGLKTRLYVPRALVGSTEPGPLLVFFHGGGFIYGNLDSHDAACRFLAEQAGLRVLAVRYRLAPEDPFPAAYDDCVAAFRSVVERAAELGADPGRIGVGGDSAGGNLAAVVALAAPESCAFQVLIYPTTDAAHDTESARLFGSGFYLTAEFMELAGTSYVPAEITLDEPTLSPLHADVPADLPPAYLCTAGFDPLRDEGEAYAEKLRAAGVDVVVQRFPDQIHGFFNAVGGGASMRSTNAELARQVRELVGRLG